MKPPRFSVRDDIQRAPHYARHVNDPERRVLMLHATDKDMDALIKSAGDDRLRGVPTVVNYKHGIIRVWPWPAEGWQVWSEASDEELKL